MFLRILYFLTVQFLSALAVWIYKDALHAVLTAWLISCLWLFLDVWRLAAIVKWLQRGNLDQVPHLSGAAGKIVHQFRRLLKNARTEVDNREDRLQEVLAALQATPNGVVLLDANGHIEWCNHLASSQLGIDVSRDMMQSIGNLVRDPDFAAYYAEKNFNRDVVIVGRGSVSSRPIFISIHIHLYGDGRQLLLSRDVTALEQADAMRRDFVANVSHEIKTPLTVLTGFVETLQTLSLTEEERARYLGLMAQQASRMQSVVQDLLILSRLEGSPLPTLTEWISIQVLMQRCHEDAEALSQVLNRKHVQEHTFHFTNLVEENAQNTGEIAGVSVELQSAFSNLISNAIRYTPPGGVITVSWSVKNGKPIFTVSDTGFGIEAEHIPRLTERFYRVDRSRSRETGGTGLGLAIVKHVVQRHGGVLAIESIVGKGSTFIITLPNNRWRPYRSS